MSSSPLKSYYEPLMVAGLSRLMKFISSADLSMDPVVILSSVSFVDGSARRYQGCGGRGEHVIQVSS